MHGRLNVGARIAICGQISQYNLERPRADVPSRAADRLPRADAGLPGDGLRARFGEAIPRLARWVMNGDIRYRETVTDGLENAPSAFIGMLNGENRGKALVQGDVSEKPSAIAGRTSRRRCSSRTSADGSSPTERMMLAHVYLEQGCIVPTHSHENEQLTYILEGALRFWLGEDGVGGRRRRGRRGAAHPSNLPHKAEALETTLDVDVFCPPRADWLDGSDAYLRRPPWPRAEPSSSAVEAGTRRHWRPSCL